ncbi:ABC transporter permease [Comamonadaceae bacterium G21597-S1]|nr:ABC transporter permease [Comamonadaceae bacterium G21597-S1]
MLRFLIQRLLSVVPTFLGLLALMFVLIQVIPADPAIALAGENATLEQIQEVRVLYGLDKSLPEQFVQYVKQVAQLDFGVSIYSQRPVVEDMVRRIPATLELTFLGLLLGGTLGIVLGTLAAEYHNRMPDFVIRVLSVAGIGIASFWLAILLQLGLAMQLGWFPVSGRLSADVAQPPLQTGFMLVDALLAGNGRAFRDAAWHLVLPVATLSVPVVATVARFTRAAMLEALQQDFVTYERAVGYPRYRILWIYAFRPSLTAPITQIGLLFGAVIAGSVVVESIFQWPGLGTYLSQAIFAADYKPMLAVILLVGAVYMLINVAVDVILALLDPRVKERM